MSKPKDEGRTLEKYLQILHGEYSFGPAVDERMRQWWWDVAMKFLQNYCWYEYCDGNFDLVVEQHLSDKWTLLNGNDRRLMREQVHLCL